MFKSTWLVLMVVLAFSTIGFAGSSTMKALIIDGQNNHDWKATTPILKALLEQTGLFSVEVITSPPKGADFSSFKPEFSNYRLVVSNFNGEPWPEEVQKRFEAYVSSGGGFVVYHAADNAFPNWKEFNEIIGLGGWEGRNEKSGPYVRYRENRFVFENSPGSAGHHGRQHEFKIIVRDSNHPIMKGLPIEWLHAQDELYDRMRGPAKYTEFLATAYSDPQTGGSGEHEPVLLTVKYGKGRVFHTMLGHGPEAMRCVGFIATLQRGAEWAATGNVTQKLPADFPSVDKHSIRQ